MGLSVSLIVSVRLLDTTVSSAEMAELIEMPFGIWTCMSPDNHVLNRDGSPVKMAIWVECVILVALL